MRTNGWLLMTLSALSVGCMASGTNSTHTGDLEEWDDSYDYGESDLETGEESKTDVFFNATPQIVDGLAGVFWDDAISDDVWYFDAYVDDLDGLLDVTEVWADVYDEFNGEFIASFELLPDAEPDLWWIEIDGFDAGLDPFYDMYSVDLVAYDTFGDFDIMMVFPDVYNDTEFNNPPEVYDADAYVVWDDFLLDDIFIFEAYTDDLDGVLDVVEVWADVFDEFTGQHIESFELIPSDDPYVWFEEIPAMDTFLDPFYSEYTVDFVAYDELGDHDIRTVWIDTY